MFYTTGSRPPLWVAGDIVSCDFAYEQRALSLWARQKHPELITGAVGSSAPVVAELDFWRYLQVVEESIRSYSTKCAENIRKGFQLMMNLMNSELGREELSDGSYKLGYGISQVCDIMNNDVNDPLRNLQLVNKYMAMSQAMGAFCPALCLQAISLHGVASGNLAARILAGARSWTWQTCTEFGYFQSTDGGPNGIFGSVTPLSLFLNMCRDIFGPRFDSNYIANAVRSTLSYYGGAEGYKDGYRTD
ncbi:serine carboxypeptidase S28 [Dictyocaulus viviparus]|uniref:Serine carboxypeptidase S28 n=1 Tax=Dictyocaulus viviparus TaxID=29172 RepID=A0A0D8XN25_DICVI|nr:serine carboxypeptidase S28 [Dictyocaulus viviparus]